MVVTMQYSREHFASTLRRTGFPEAAGEALRVLPDPVDDDQIAAFLAPYGITLGAKLKAGWAATASSRPRSRPPGPGGRRS